VPLGASIDGHGHGQEPGALCLLQEIVRFGHHAISESFNVPDESADLGELLARKPGRAGDTHGGSNQPRAAQPDNPLLNSRQMPGDPRADSLVRNVQQLGYLPGGAAGLPEGHTAQDRCAV
jgi:hypothetical protein